MAQGGASCSLLVLLLALLLLAAGEARLAGIFLEVHHQASPRLLLVPLEAGKVWLLELIVGLQNVSTAPVGMGTAKLTLFLNCLWMASSASLIVTPLRFRAVTSSPRGKWRSIFLTGGVVSIFLRCSLSSTVVGDVLIFLERNRVSRQWCDCGVTTWGSLTIPASASPWQSEAPFLLPLLRVSGLFRNTRQRKDIPRSLMFMTPLALELARRCFVSLGGDDAMPWTAESTLVRVSGSDMLMAGGSQVWWESER